MWTTRNSYNKIRRKNLRFFGTGDFFHLKALDLLGGSFLELGLPNDQAVNFLVGRRLKIVLVDDLLESGPHVLDVLLLGVLVVGEDLRLDDALSCSPAPAPPGPGGWG